MPHRAKARAFVSHADYKPFIQLLASDYSPPVVDKCLKSLHPSVVQRILKFLEAPPRNASSLQVLRALWCCPALRPSILCVLTSPTFESASRDDRLVNEVEVLLAADATDASRSPRLRTQTISTSATAICIRSKHQKTRNTGPLLVFCARAAGQVRTRRGRALQRRILKHILSALETTLNTSLELFIAILDSDMHMDAADELLFLRALDAFVELHCKDREIPALFRAMVASLPRVRSRRHISIIGQIVLNILRKTTPASLSNVLDILSTVIMDSEVVCQRLVDAISIKLTLLKTSDDLFCQRTKLAPSHISMMYFLLASTSSQRIREGIKKIIEKITWDVEVSFDTSHVASSSTHSGEPPFLRAFGLLSQCQIPAVGSNGETIASVFEAHVWSPQIGSQTWGVRMLFDVFVLVPRSRGKVLDAIITSLTNSETPNTVMQAFCGLLEQMCCTQKSALHLREFGLDLQNLLNSIDCIPLQVDCKIVSALVRLSITNPKLSENMFLFLRKASGSRLLKLQRVACAGLLAIIEHDSVSEENQFEACKSFGDIIELSGAPLRAHCIAQLIAFVDRNISVKGHLRTVSELVVRRLALTAGLSTGSLDMAASKSFGGFVHSRFAQDDLRLLLRLFYKLKPHNEVIERFLLNLRDYMGNIKLLFRDASVVCGTVASPSPRMAQLCSLFEVMVCAEGKNLSPLHIRGYAVCLLMQEYGDSKKGNTSAAKCADTSALRSDVNVFAAVSAREAVSLEVRDLQDIGTGTAESIMEYAGALCVVSKSCTEDLWRGVAQRELMRIILVKLRYFVQGSVKATPGVEAFEPLFSFLKQCFMVSSPWGVVESHHSHDGDGAAENDVVTMNAMAVPEDRSRFATSNLQCTECKRRASVFLRDVDFPDVQIDESVVLPLVSQLSKSLPSSIRHFSLAIFVELLSICELENEWTLVQDFMREPLNMGKGMSRNTGLLSPEDRESLTTADCPSFMLCGLKSPTDECAEHIETAVTVTQVFRLEFEHSLSTALTMSYIDLLSSLVRAVNEKYKDGCNVTEIISSTVLGLLRDYSIRQSRVLKAMMSLLMMCFGEKSGVDFSIYLVRWLGSDICLQSCRTTGRSGEIAGRIGVDEFDVDILEEALLSDMPDWDRHATISRRDQEVSRDISPNGDGTLCSENAHDAMDIEGKIGMDFIKSLCLNETEENALLSISSVLEYCSSLLRSILEVHRRFTKHGYPDSGTNMSSLTGVVNVLDELSRTAFMRSPATQMSNVVLPVLKRLGDLMQDLVEIVEIQIPIILRYMKNSQDPIEFGGTLVPTAKKILELLSEDETRKYQLNSLQFTDQRSRMIFLQERLDTTATAFLCCNVGQCSGPLHDLRALLQARIGKNKGVQLGKDADDEANYGVQAKVKFHSRPRKKPHVRSRNRYVDGWLREEKGDDNFVDLEDFIVPLDTTS